MHMYLRGRVDFISKMLSFLCSMQIVQIVDRNCPTEETISQGKMINFLVIFSLYCVSYTLHLLSDI